ncbi:MAG: hypothetical protein ACFE8E_12370 [Candidatus Hodarchaeota archaeon]
MFSKSRIEEIVRKNIEKNERLGNLTDGGFSAHAIYNLGKINDPKKIKIANKDCWEIIYEYSILVTEVRSLEENNSREYDYRKKICVDKDGNVISEDEKELLADITWD